ncbi:HutD family protein [Herbaspirillum lusitanum]|uniref:HutD family protein n=1 Tax=Herbaspirillum lusitanum TaxID=213312 RepID=A0ABW9AGK2_9BURK
MQIISVDALPAQLWRNGAGLTRLIASGAAGQQLIPGQPHLDEADWRISLADIQSDGPFSTFPGVDRHAVLLGRGAVRLSGPIGGAHALPLTPIAFPGEAELHATREPASPAAPHQFLNLMVKRKSMRSEMRVIGSAEVQDAAALLFVLVVAGEWMFRPAEDGAGDCRLRARQAGIVRALAAGAVLAPLQADAKAVLIRLSNPD